MSSTSDAQNSSAYSVVFYTRKNKVHKSKGVSKMDGTLTVRFPPLSTVTLKSENADQEDASEDEDTNSSNKKRKRSQTVSSAKGIVYSGTQRDIAKSAMEGILNEDDVIALGGYEVQIISVLGQLTMAIAPKAIKPATSTVSGGMRSTKFAISKPPLLSSNETTKAERKPPAQPQKNTKIQQHSLGVRKIVTTKQNLIRRPLASTTNAGVVPQKHKLNAQQRPTTSLMKQPSASTISTVGASVLPHIPLPSSIRRALKEHQLIAVDFLWTSLNSLHGSILADEMGLGKTLTTIAIICAFYRQNRVKNFLVVCPSSLVGNWGAEFDKWIGKACEPKRVVIRSGGEQAQQDMQTFCQNPKGQVLILSYDLFRRNAALVSNIDVSILVVDEGHRLKNKNGSLTMTALQTISADARLCITATPVQNNLVEFHSLVNFTCPGLLGDLATFVKEFDRPITKAHSKNATVADRKRGEMMSAKLEKMTESFVLRRLQKDVLKTMLPSRTEALLFCLPTPEQCNMYQSIAASQESGDGTESLTSLIELRKVCVHPCLVNPQLGNSLHLSGKLRVLDATLQSIRSTSPDDKVVVVSNFTSMLSLLEKAIMQPMGYTYSRLDGAVEISRRQGLVDCFNRTSADKQFCFLLSSKAGGCGLNLVGANRLILVDNDWNPATDIQAMGRVYRQGQTKPCTIYRLITSGTIEEVIYQRQNQKERLAAMSVDSQSQGRFTKEELADCFTLKSNCPCDTKQKVGDAWPNYEGQASLKEWGCMDEPLLEISETAKQYLGFVHIVEEAASTIASASGNHTIAVKQTDADSVASTSEEEFSMSDDGE